MISILQPNRLLWVMDPSYWFLWWFWLSPLQ